jgi:hypothetical protein
MELVSHYRAQAEGCRNCALRVNSENLQKRYTALAEAYLALAAEREHFLKAKGEKTVTVGLVAAPGEKNDRASGAS